MLLRAPRFTYFHPAESGSVSCAVALRVHLRVALLSVLYHDLAKCLKTLVALGHLADGPTQSADILTEREWAAL